MSDRVDEHGYPLRTERHIQVELDLECLAEGANLPCAKCARIRKRVDDALLAVYTEGSSDTKKQLLIAFDRGRSQGLDLDGIRELMERVTFTPSGD